MFVSYLSGITLLCCLISSVLKTIISCGLLVDIFVLFLGFFVVSNGRVNLVPISTSWSQTFYIQ